MGQTVTALILHCATCVHAVRCRGWRRRTSLQSVSVHSTTSKLFVRSAKELTARSTKPSTPPLVSHLLSYFFTTCSLTRRANTDIACSQRRHGQDRNVLCCPRWQCEHSCQQDKTVLSFVLTQFPACNCSVSNILRITENLEIGNCVETRQNFLVLSAVVFTPTTWTGCLSVV